jgi:hypothetical protein
MRDALQLFDQLDIKYIPSREAQRRGPMSTCCGNVVERLIRSRGVEHATIVLRAIVESEGNSGELIADIIFAISDIVRMHPRWVDLGLQWLEAFDKINLASIRRTAKATGAVPLHSAVMVLLCAELERILGPSKLPKPPKPAKVKAPSKPRRSVTGCLRSNATSRSAMHCSNCDRRRNGTTNSAGFAVSCSTSTRKRPPS